MKDLINDGCELSEAVKDLRERAAEITESEMSEPFTKAISLLALCNGLIKNIERVLK